MSTIEGGMICTDDPDLYEMLRMLRSHGMVREVGLRSAQAQLPRAAPRPEPRFHLRLPGLQRPQHGDQRRARPRPAQAPRPEQRAPPRQPPPVPGPPRPREIPHRLRARRELQLRLHADPAPARPGLQRDRSSSACARPRSSSAAAPPAAATSSASPTSRKLLGDREFEKYPKVDHVHFFGYYIGNYPELEREQDPGPVRPAQPARVSPTPASE